MWHDDLRAWEQELREILKNKELDTAVEKHLDALRTHAAAIRLYEQQAATHEHAIAAFEQGEPDGTLIEMSQKHAEEATRHAQQRDAHRRVRKHHAAVMSRWRALVKALNASC
jgi:hypothetical protein